MALDFSTELNAFSEDEAGVKNPLYLSFVLLPSFWFEYTRIVLEVFNDYMLEIMTDPRLFEIWRRRSKQIKKDWLEIARQLTQLLAVEVNQPNIDASALEEQIWPTWQSLTFAQSENYLEQLAQYCRDNEIFGGRCGALFVALHYAPQNVDAPVIEVAAKYPWSKAARVPVLKVAGLTSLTLFVDNCFDGVKDLVNKKIKSAAQREWLKEETDRQIDAVKGNEFPESNQ